MQILFVATVDYIFFLFFTSRFLNLILIFYLIYRTYSRNIYVYNICTKYQIVFIL